MQFITLLPSLSPTTKVKRADYRGSNNKQTPFKETFKRKRTKKKKNDSERVSERVSEQATVSGGENSTGTKYGKRHVTENNAAESGKSFDSLHNRIIDIRV
jgi:hypothetical protein